MFSVEVTSAVGSQHQEPAEAGKGVTGEEHKEQRVLVICSGFPGRKTILRGSSCHLLSVALCLIKTSFYIER